jgi:hypothetical protein
VVLRSSLIALYVRARDDVPGLGRKLSEVYIAGYSATTGVWLMSIFVPRRFVTFGVGAKLAITEAGHPGLTAGARWALAGGIGPWRSRSRLFTSD